MPEKYQIRALPALSDNYIWLIHDEQQALVVDPTEAKLVSDYLTEHSLSLAGILLTHSHADHTGGVAGLVAEYSVAVIDNFTNQLSAGQQILIAGFPPLVVLLTPGHMFEHVCYIFDQQHLFCGDTLFACGCGRVFTHDYLAMHTSLKRLARLDPNLLCYPAHEYTAKNLSFTHEVSVNFEGFAEYSAYLLNKLASQGITLPTRLADELKYNLFLRCDQPQLWLAVEQLTQQKITSSLECFTALRHLRNNF